MTAIEGDPTGVAVALSGYLDYEDIQQQLDPDPADLESVVDDLASQVQGLAGDLDDLASDLDDLCLDLTFAPAVESDITSC